jgi:hypothetical protein
LLSAALSAAVAGAMPARSITANAGIENRRYILEAPPIGQVARDDEAGTVCMVHLS